jgi:hypothetical protein
VVNITLPRFHNISLLWLVTLVVSIHILTCYKMASIAYNIGGLVIDKRYSPTSGRPKYVVAVKCKREPSFFYIDFFFYTTCRCARSRKEICMQWYKNRSVPYCTVPPPAPFSSPHLEDFQIARVSSAWSLNPMIIYFRVFQSLGAAQAVAQCARWKTVVWRSVIML